MMQFESIKSPDDLDKFPIGSVIGGSLETYARTANGWCACTLGGFYMSTQIFAFLPVGMMTGSRRIMVYYKP